MSGGLCVCVCVGVCALGGLYDECSKMASFQASLQMRSNKFNSLPCLLNLAASSIGNMPRNKFGDLSTPSEHASS